MSMKDLWRDIDDGAKTGENMLLYFPLEGLSENWRRIIIARFDPTDGGWIFQGRSVHGYSPAYQPTKYIPLEEPGFLGLDFAEVERRAIAAFSKQGKDWSKIAPDTQAELLATVIEGDRKTAKPTLIRWAEENEQEARNLRIIASTDPARRHAIKTAQHLERRAAEYRRTVEIRGDK